MKSWLTAACGLMIVAGLARADAGDDKPLVDFWQAVFVNGARVGHVHTVARKIDQDGKPLIRTTAALVLKLRRGGDVLDLAMDTGTIEDAKGQVTGTFMRQYLGKRLTVEVNGTVVGKELRLMRDQKTPLQPAPWHDGVMGLYRQQSLLTDRPLKPGDKFSYRSFEHSINLVISNQVVVQDYEEVEPFAGSAKIRLLRVEVRPEKIASAQLSPSRHWVNDAGTEIRTEMAVPGLGTLVLYRTSAALAQAAGDPAHLPDVLSRNYIHLNRRIDRALETTAAVYRIVAKDLDDPGKAFSRDDRQEIKNLKGNTFELHVRARKVAKEQAEGRVKPGPEYTQGSFYITSDDPQVKKLARAAVGQEKDPWKKGVAIEKWVFERMTATQDQDVVPADQVARTLKGDSTEYAMLMAAMCRAEAIPARTAFGFVYAEVKEKPVFMLCMWTEVWIDGCWLALDATQGRGGVGATHLKIADQSWHNERTLTPLSPIVGILDRLRIEIVHSE